MSTKLYSVADHDDRIRDLNGRGMSPLEIAVTMGDVLVLFFRPTDGFVKARLKAMGLAGNPSGAGRRGRRPAPRALAAPAP